MSFMPQRSVRIVPGSGNKDSTIAIVGDYTTGYDENVMRPFQGSASNIEKCLHLAGLIRGEVYMTNLFKTKSQDKVSYGSKKGPYPSMFDESKFTFTDAGNLQLQWLREELDDCKANVIVACGRATAFALAGVRKLGERRGYVHSSIGLKEPRKVIPTFHPANAVRSNYLQNHLITSDLAKAKVERSFRELRRPERNLVYDFGSVEECVQWIEYFRGKSPLSVDIEVLHYEMSCINLSDQKGLGVVIPLAGEWDELEELQLWQALVPLLEDTRTIKIFQNGIFDIHFLAMKYGIRVGGEIHDTMIAHHCMWPDLQKGLGFLGSLYCGSQEYWKDMADFKNIKGEA